MTPGAFVTATGTGAGKTCVTRGIARSLVRRGTRAIALKPIETGVDPDPLDAIALAKACGRPRLANEPAFYRARPPLSPYAASLQEAIAAPDLAGITGRIQELASDADSVWIEGAGGLLVPLDAHTSMADFAARLGWPILLVAPDQLGVLSHALTAIESAERRGLVVAAVVLAQLAPNLDDASTRTNALILEERLMRPILPFAHCRDDDDALADAADACGVLATLLPRPPAPAPGP
jgi:dethiobiotin synthetase